MSIFQAARLLLDTSHFQLHKVVTKCSVVMYKNGHLITLQRLPFFFSYSLFDDIFNTILPLQVVNLRAVLEVYEHIEKNGALVLSPAKKKKSNVK